MTKISPALPAVTSSSTSKRVGEGDRNGLPFFALIHQGEGETGSSANTAVSDLRANRIGGIPKAKSKDACSFVDLNSGAFCLQSQVLGVKGPITYQQVNAPDSDLEPKLETSATMASRLGGKANAASISTSGVLDARAGVRDTLDATGQAAVTYQLGSLESGVFSRQGATVTPSVAASGPFPDLQNALRTDAALVQNLASNSLMSFPQTGELESSALSQEGSEKSKNALLSDSGRKYLVDTAPPLIGDVMNVKDHLEEAIASSDQAVIAHPYAFSELGVFGRDAPIEMSYLGMTNPIQASQGSMNADGIALTSAIGVTQPYATGGDLAAGDIPSGVSTTAVQPGSNSGIQELATVPTQVLTFTSSTEPGQTRISLQDANEIAVGTSAPDFPKLQPARVAQVSLTIVDDNNLVSVIVRDSTISSDAAQVLKRLLEDVAREHGVSLGEMVFNGGKSMHSIWSTGGAGNGRRVG